MKVNQLIKHSKERFVSPAIKCAGLELEDEFLVGSPGTEMEYSIKSVGHDIGGEYTISNDSYWE